MSRFSALSAAVRLLVLGGVVGFPDLEAHAELLWSTSFDLQKIDPTAAINPASNGSVVTDAANGGFGVAGDGTIYAYDQGVIGKFAFDGTVLNASLVTGIPNVGEILVQGTDFWAVRSSPLEARRYNSAGTLQQTIDLSVMSSGSRAMAIDSAGAYYFINSNQVFKYSSAGTWTGGFITIAGTNLFDIIIDSNDNLLISSQNTSRIYKTDTSLSAASSYITSALSIPKGLGLDPDDNLYVVNSLTNQISKFDSAGSLVEANFVYGTLPNGAGLWTTVAVPEPGTTWAALITSLGGLAAIRRHRKSSF